MTTENITSEAIDPSTRTLKDTTLQFLSGVLAGSLLLLVPLSYFQFFTVGLTLTAIQIVGTVGVILLCGLLSVIWGRQAIAVLMKLLESSPWQ